MYFATHNVELVLWLNCVYKGSHSNNDVHILKKCIKIDLYMFYIHINAILLGKQIQNMSC